MEAGAVVDFFLTLPLLELAGGETETQWREIKSLHDATLKQRNKQPCTQTHLEELQEGRLGHAGFLYEGHGVGEVVHIVAVDVQHHGLGELRRQRARSEWEWTAPLGSKVAAQSFQQKHLPHLRAKSRTTLHFRFFFTGKLEF